MLLLGVEVWFSNLLELDSLEQAIEERFQKCQQVPRIFLADALHPLNRDFVGLAVDLRLNHWNLLAILQAVDAGISEINEEAQVLVLKQLAVHWD